MIEKLEKLKKKDISDAFPIEDLYGIQELDKIEIPYFGDFANYWPGRVLPIGFSYQQ